MLCYSSNWKRKTNKGIARFVKVSYSNCTVNVVEMSRKRLNDKGAVKNIFSDNLWRDESVTCRENSESVRIRVMTHLFFWLLNTAEKESEIIQQGLCEVPAAIIRIKAIGLVFEECIYNSECSRTKSAVPFADTLIHLRHARSSKLKLGHIIGMIKSTYEKEYRPPNLDAVWNSGTIDKFPNLLHQLYRIVIVNGPSIVTISACYILYVGRNEHSSPNTIILGTWRKFRICKLLAA